MCFTVTAEVELGDVLQRFPCTSLTWKNKLILALAAFPAPSGFLFSLSSPWAIGWCVCTQKRTWTAFPSAPCSPQHVLAQKCLFFLVGYLFVFSFSLCAFYEAPLCVWGRSLKKISIGFFGGYELIFLSCSVELGWVICSSDMRRPFPRASEGL